MRAGDGHNKVNTALAGKHTHACHAACVTAIRTNSAQHKMRRTTTTMR